MSFLTEEVPNATGFLSVWLATVVIQFIVLAVAIRRYRQVMGARSAISSGQTSTQVPKAGLIPPLLALLGALVIPTLAALQVSRSRAQIIDGYVRDDAARVELLVQGVIGAITTPLLAVRLSLVTSCTGLAALLVWFCARSSAQGLERARTCPQSEVARAWLSHPGPTLKTVLLSGAAFCLGTLLPVTVGVNNYSATLMIAWGRSANAEPSQRAAVLLSSLEPARSELETWLLWAGLGALLTALLVTWLVLIRPYWQRRGVAPGNALTAGPPWWEAVTVVLLLGSAAAAIHLSAPARAENNLAVEPPRSGVFRPKNDLQGLPLLRGPDDIGPAPLLQVDGNAATLDGRPVDEEELARSLDVLLKQVPGLSAPGALPPPLTVACPAGVNIARLWPLLVAARQLSAFRIQLLLGAWHMEQRPLFGQLRRAEFSAAHALLPKANSENASAEAAVAVRLEHGTCRDLAREIIRARELGHTAILEPPDGTP